MIYPAVVVLILARGGSKGIRLKNLQTVGGSSLVWRAARACADAESVDRVFVYSDHPEILQEAERAGATGVERPAEVSGDRVTSEESVQRFLRDHDMGTADIMLAQATSPFLKTSHVQEAVSALHSRYSALDSVISVYPVVNYLGFLCPDAYWRPLYPSRWRRQDFSPDLYAESGALYLSKRSVWDSGRRMGDRTGIVVAGRWESVEIDDQEDLEVCRALEPVLFKKGDPHAVSQRSPAEVSLEE